VSEQAQRANEEARPSGSEPSAARRHYVTVLIVDDTPKMLRETLCVAQTHVGLSGDPRAREHADRLQRLIDECDRHRPLRPDGKHGNFHTPTCGCEDDELSSAASGKGGSA
jgi:hypothetical protein